MKELTREEKINNIKGIDLSQIYSAYNGKEGCMCGCMGDYAIASSFVDFASKDRGYLVQENEVNDKKVKMRYNKIMNILDNKEADIFYDFDGEKGFFGFDHNGRTYACYFVKR